VTDVARIEALAAVAADSAPADAKTAARSWQGVEDRLRGALDRLWLRATHFAWIETRPTAVTGVGYLGDIRTVAAAGAAARDLAVHSNTVARVLDARNRFLRLSVAAFRTASALSLSASNPLFSLSAARNAWALVQEIEKELGSASAP
jgi:hypothetical protein